MCVSFVTFVGIGGELNATAVGKMKPVYTYTFEKGFLNKAGISGSSISHNKAANEKFYNTDKSPSEIALEEGAGAEEDIMQE